MVRGDFNQSIDVFVKSCFVNIPKKQNIITCELIFDKVHKFLKDALIFYMYYSAVKFEHILKSGNFSKENVCIKDVVDLDNLRISKYTYSNIPQYNCFDINYTNFYVSVKYFHSIRCLLKHKVH